MHSTGERWKLGRRPALDGLRGLAVLLVIAHHSLAQWNHAAGTVGVTVFFTLSGFLITVLLLEERDRTRTIDLRAFYLRRARRLVPALAVFLVVVFAASTIIAQLASTATLPAILLYVTNWLPASGVPTLGLEHLWSLSVEEQFYLAWPLLLLASARRFGDRGVAVVAGVGVVASVVLRFALWHGGAGADRIYYGTDTRIDGMLVGCLVAVLVRAGLRVSRGPAVAGVSVACLLLLSASTGRDLLAPTLTPWLTALVLIAVSSGGTLAALGSRWLRYLGRRSYALYLWHFPLLWLTYPLGPVAQVEATTLGLVVSVLLAELSWRYVERPFLHKRLQGRGDGAVARLPRPVADRPLPARHAEAV